ncbi:hypothetical protein [Spirosoma sp.]|nr:hypothetical protein [Spirosoma sp.]
MTIPVDQAEAYSAIYQLTPTDCIHKAAIYKLPLYLNKRSKYLCF